MLLNWLFIYYIYLCVLRPSWSLAVVVLVISMGLGLLVAGETEFNLAGFVIVMVASALSGLRWTITQVLLQGSEAHGTGALLRPGLLSPRAAPPSRGFWSPCCSGAFGHVRVGHRHARVPGCRWCAPVLHSPCRVGSKK